MHKQSRVNRFNYVKWLLIFFFSLSTHHVSSTLLCAAHDTGTQGKGIFRFEVMGEFVIDEESSDDVTTKKTAGEVATALTYGITDNLDIGLALPYAWSKTKIGGIVDPADPAADAGGISDVSLELKWRFYEHNGFSLAMIPGITLPTGDEKKGLGNGRSSCGLILIATKAIDPWAFHLTLGYGYNEYKLQSDQEAKRKGIWHFSVGSEVEVVKNLRATVYIGMDSNQDKMSNTHPAFVRGEMKYDVGGNIEVNFGIKGGLNKPADDMTVFAGIARSF